MKIDPWTLKAVPLQLLYQGKELYKATGFFWKSSLDVWLVTNWHVLSGAHPYTHKLQADREPDAVTYPRYVDKDDPGKGIFYVKEDLKDKCGNNLWCESKTYSSEADVAALPLPRFVALPDGSLSHVHPVATLGPYTNLAPFIGLGNWVGPHRAMGEELFVLGFPLGITPTEHYPIWKRASVASEMNVPLAHYPAFLIDSATRKGMSGSPVVHLERTSSLNSYVNRKISFQGVYSGRQVRKDLDEAALGVVWREEVIHDILANSKTGVMDPARLALREEDYLK